MAKTDNQEKDKLFSDLIINNSRSMISIINRDYIYEKVNRLFCSAQKGTKRSFIGRSLADVWGKDIFAVRIKERVDQCFEGKTVRYKASFMTPKSGTRSYEVVFRPVRSEIGEVTHVMAETFDVTGIRKSQKEANDIRRKFKKMELSFETRLFEARKLETIGVLAGGIAHDFNSILATISGYAEMLGEDFQGNEDIRDKTDKILWAVNRAQQLISQILTFSRQVDQEKVCVNLTDILKETVGFIRSAASPGITIKAEYWNHDAFVFADPTQLFRVFLNLMTNAVQSMEEKGGILAVKLETVYGKKIRSRMRRDILADEYVHIAFKDTGRGMSRSVMQRIFEPFYTSREVGKGTGLGLSVVHGIISELEGEILVSSKENLGSVFDVYLPLTDDHINDNNNKKERKRILFIKGNNYESGILSVALEKSGYELAFASDPGQLGRLFPGKNDYPDVVIYMIDPGNISTGDLLKFYEKLKINTPCILISDPGKSNIGEELLALGINSHHLFKPVSLKELTGTIRKSLSK